MNKVLIKIDKNGSKHYKGMVTCDRCGGKGGSDVWEMTGYTCYKCGGTGMVEATWIERTPEYQAKLDARRAKRQAKKQAEFEARQADYEAKKRLAEEAEKAREAEIKAQKAISQYVGEAGDKIEMTVTYLGSPHWTTHMGWMEKTMYAHNFKEANGNKLVWKTESYPSCLTEGAMVLLKGTIKDHSEYDGEKQTLLTRCKIQEVEG